MGARRKVRAWRSASSGTKECRASHSACNRLHSLSERLARWLLISEDRARRPDLPLTQEFLSLMLGVRRPGVTEAAIVLQAQGLIDCASPSGTGRGWKSRPATAPE